MRPPAVRALIFDTFGTLVDWRTSIVRDLEAFGTRRGIACDWTALVDAWRGAYVPSMARVRSGASPWRNLDALHAESLDELAPSFGLASLSVDDRRWIVRRWHELEAWPDVRAGLERLRERHIVATFSNGNVALLVDLARHANLRFDAILSAEIFRHYKPDPQTYLGAAALLDCEPGEVMLVAAHNDDLQAARGLGLRSAFVARPTEYGPHQDRDFEAESGVDVAVRDLGELADAFGAAEIERAGR
ncbi:MAG: haloacid dehalogenase type II [Candidatus Eremiobacteraeota bacterium]|nr:haloacid dehalogenase type II [Candidatus Eremiobacteraeota bacterium]